MTHLCGFLVAAVILCGHCGHQGCGGCGRLMADEIQGEEEKIELNLVQISAEESEEKVQS